jgi:hypothetical protein
MTRIGDPLPIISNNDGEGEKAKGLKANKGDVCNIRLSAGVSPFRLFTLSPSPYRLAAQRDVLY